MLVCQPGIETVLLRIILWKLGIELAHLRRALSSLAGTRVYYFAFGANLSEEVLATRRIRVFDSFEYVLDDADLRFSQPGFYRDHGYASADAADGERVYGRMYQMLASDARRMDYFEGVPFIGAHDKIYRNGGDFEFFFYRTTRIVEGLKPTREYLDYLLDAYGQMTSVPQAYIERLAAIDVLEQFAPLDRTGMFVSEIDRWPPVLHPLLLRYERLCTRLVEFLWHRSPLQWLIRT